MSERVENEFAGSANRRSPTVTLVNDLSIILITIQVLYHRSEIMHISAIIYDEWYISAAYISWSNGMWMWRDKVRRFFRCRCETDNWLCASHKMHALACMDDARCELVYQYTFSVSECISIALTFTFCVLPLLLTSFKYLLCSSRSPILSVLLLANANRMSCTECHSQEWNILLFP